MNINHTFPIEKPISKIRIFYYMSIAFILELPAAFYSLYNFTKINEVNIFLFESFLFAFFYIICITFKGDIRNRNGRFRKYGIVFAIIFFYNIYISYKLFNIFLIEKSVEIYNDSKLILLFSISFTQCLLIIGDVIFTTIKIM
jgi:hypothetical protein